MGYVLRIAAAILFLSTGAFSRADDVTFKLKGQEVTVQGNIVGEDGIGTLLLEAPDTRHYFIRASDVLARDKGAAPVPLYNDRQLRSHLLDEYGKRFRLHSTRRYLVCYSCSPEFAKEAGALFERAYAVFTNYFSKKGGFRYKKPPQRLVAVIFASRAEFVAALRDEVGSLASQSAGVYVHQFNRMYLYDSFGDTPLANVARNDRRKAQRLAGRLHERNVSTVIHEAIHQIAYNVGFHTRNTVNPLWFVEGMATYFESPDLDSRGGWKGVGKINRERLLQFRTTFRQRSKSSLKRLILNDSLLRDPKTALDGYAEAWAFTYFLARAKTSAYMDYVRLINERTPLSPDTPEIRLREFRKAFRKSPEALELDFRRYISRVVLKE